jgi:hypothetical protein
MRIMYTNPKIYATKIEPRITFHVYSTSEIHCYRNETFSSVAIREA